MKINLFAAAAIGLFAFTSCVDDTRDITTPALEASGPDATTFIHDQDEDGITNVAPSPFDGALLNHSQTVSEDYFNAERIVTTRPDGTQETRYLVGGDIELSKSELQTLQGLDESLLKQYRTNNLVSIRTINVVGYTGGGNALTSKMRTALRWAVDNYNGLNTNKTFNLRFAASTDGDIIVYRQPNNNGAGGRAGFPSGGRPYKWVQIYNGMEGYDTNTNEHVITHEMGHAMGLRHTDYFSRESCRQSGESANPDGAVFIPGTPRGFDPNSVMLSCFSAGEDGEFGRYDRVALEFLY